MKYFLKLTVVCLILTLLSCRTSKYPICTKLSNSKPSSINGVSSTLFKICQERNITITVLSSTIIELRGTIKQMKWFQKNYHIIMCDFDQVQTPIDESTYLSCMANAKEWIKIVQSNRPDTLMITQTKFCPNCCE